MFYELKEKAKSEVASSREKAEKALLDLIPDSTMLDWQKAFKAFTKDATPAEVKEKDLFRTDVPEKAHDFEHPTEEKFKLPKDPEKAIPGNGREADERKEVTQEAGVLQKDIVAGTSKEAALAPVADGASASTTPSMGAPMDENVIREAFKQMCEGGGEEVIMDLLLQYMPVADMKGMLDDFSDMGEWAPDEQHYEHAGVPMAVAKLKTHALNKKAMGCPVCGQTGKDMKTSAKENTACDSCGITYAKASMPEIKAKASKADTIKKIAEVTSPWAVTTDEQGNEVIARVDAAATTTKESEEDLKTELVKSASLKSAAAPVDPAADKDEDKDKELLG
jgi:ribosomal protein L37AE/L43A